MSKSKVALITAAIVTTVGIAGSIITGLTVVPKTVSQMINEVENSTFVESEISSYSDEINSLNFKIDTSDHIKLEFRVSADNNLRIKTYDINKNYYNINSKYIETNKNLDIDIIRNKKVDIERDFKRIYPRIIGARIDEELLIIEAPRNVDIKIDSSNPVSLDIKSDGILKDSLIINSHGSRGWSEYNIPDNNTLKKVEIASDDSLELSVLDFINAENVDIQGDYIKITSNGINDNHDLNKLPSNVNLRGRRIEVKSYIPIGKNVDIYSEDDIQYTSNFNDYKYTGIIDNKKEWKNNYDNNKHNQYENEVDLEEYYENGLKLENMGVALKEGVYEGNYSNAEGEQYNLNITAVRDGNIINDTKSNIKNSLLIQRNRR